MGTCFNPEKLVVTVSLEKNQLKIATLPECEVASELLLKILFDPQIMCLTDNGKTIFKMLETVTETSVSVYWEKMEIDENQIFHRAVVEPSTMANKEEMMALTQLGANCLVLITPVIGWLNRFPLEALEKAYREMIMENQGRIRPISILRWANEFEKSPNGSCRLGAKIAIEEQKASITLHVSGYPDYVPSCNLWLPFHQWANNKIADVIREKLLLIDAELAAPTDLS